MILAIASVTLRAAVGRRRFLLLIGLAAIPVLLALLLAAGGSTRGAFGGALEDAGAVIDQLIVRAILPLIALVLGTGVLGTELEDGTAVYLLTKPVERWRIVIAKLIVAAGLSIVLVGVSTLLTAVLIGGGAAIGSFALGYVAAVAIGASVYAAAFLAVSIVTTRAFIVGLAYTLVWEGILAGLFEGTQLLSIRQYTVGIANALTDVPSTSITTPISATVAIIGSVLVFAIALVVATDQLAATEVRPAD